MEGPLSEEEIKIIAAQLRCPSGRKGSEVAEMMHVVNIGMTRKAMASLEISENDSFLEIGHGNCSHLEEILDSAKNIRYTGLDISALMHQEAKAVNSKFLRSEQASFHIYDGEKIPFSDNSFHKIMTVNTIYFWERPLDFMMEIYRVLKNKGRFSIAFGQKEFMEELPFAKYGFNLYGTKEVQNLVGKTSFEIEKIEDHSEKVKSKTGELVERKFTVICLQK